MIREFSASERPKRDRATGVTKFEKTPEWKVLEGKLKKGLKPKGGVLIVLTPEEMAAYGIQNRRSIQRFLQKYLAEHGLDYTVKAFTKDGNDAISVSNNPDAAQA